MPQDHIKKRLYDAFNPIEALPSYDKRYVECNAVRGSADLLNRLANAIYMSDKPTCQLLSGHRGCGKTTELYRLHHLLMREAPEDLSYFVVYCEADTYLDLTDTVEYTDVFLTVLQQLWQVAKQQQVQLEPGPFTSFLHSLQELLHMIVTPKDVTVQLPLLEIGFELKRNPTYRQHVRDYLRPRATELLQVVNEILEKVLRRLQDGNPRCAGLVVIVDNLDRLLPQTIPNTTRLNYEELFIHSAGQLTALACHIIYTVPPALLHSAQGANLEVHYGTLPHMLPMIPITTRDGEDNQTGIATLLEILQKRLLFANVVPETAFDAVATRQRLCTMSGGYMRSLMTLAREALLYTTNLPIQNAAVEHAVLDARNSFVRGILNEEQWSLLRRVATTKTIDDTDNSRQLLANHAVLEYLDEDGPWYDVSPIVKKAKAFVL